MALETLSKLPIISLFLSGARHCLFPENGYDFKVGLAQTATAVIPIIQHEGAKALINDFTRVDTSSFVLSTIVAYEATRKAFRDEIYDFNLIGFSLMLPVVGSLIHATQYERECSLKRIPVNLIRISFFNLLLALSSEGMNLAWRWGAKKLS